MYKNYFFYKKSSNALNFFFVGMKPVSNFTSAVLEGAAHAAIITPRRSAK